MGKDIIINSCDFSVNGFIFDVNIIDGTIFIVGKSYTSNPPHMNAAASNRCCFNVSIGSEYSVYSKIKMIVKDGFDYVFGVNNGTVTKWYKGNEIVTSFAWVVSTQEVVAPISVGDVIYVNLRYDDDTTVFANDTVISDIVDSIVLTS